jgi:hypothetical protein
MTSLAISWMDVFTWLFLIANAGGMLAYMPQIVAAWKRPSGAKNVLILARSRIGIRAFIPISWLAKGHRCSSSLLPVDAVNVPNQMFAADYLCNFFETV